jgi:glycosyltransferase involved in cell wall biosynthesis
MPKVSVISTVYNGAKYFDRSVPSVLGQTLEDFEWVIVDDGSTDGTAPLLARLAAEQPNVCVISAGRIGRARALNLATAQTQGTYVANQDFDDASSRDRLRLQADFLDEHPDVGVVGGHYVVIDENRGERYIRMPPTQHEQIARAMASRIPFAHTVVMFRKEAWCQAGGYPIVDRLIDFRLWIAMGRIGWRFATLPTVVGEHFIYPDSYWKANFAYRDSQRELARVQLQAIHALELPFWTRIYPTGRRLYWSLPTNLKRVARRSLAGSRERDLPVP